MGQNTQQKMIISTTIIRTKTISIARTAETLQSSHGKVFEVVVNNVVEKLIEFVVFPEVVFFGGDVVNSGVVSFDVKVLFGSIVFGVILVVVFGIDVVVIRVVVFNSEIVVAFVVKEPTVDVIESVV